jgi:hypothetical protein
MTMHQRQRLPFGECGEAFLRVSHIEVSAKDRRGSRVGMGGDECHGFAALLAMSRKVPPR